MIATELAKLERDLVHLWIEREVLAGALNRIWIGVDAKRTRGAKPPRRDRQHAGAGPDIQDRCALEIERLQRGQAETGRRVMSCAETHRGLDEDHQGPGAGAGVWGLGTGGGGQNSAQAPAPR